MATTKVGGGVVDLNSDNTAFQMPVGSTLYSGTPVAGMIRNNTSLTSSGSATAFEYYDGTQWVAMENVLPAPLEVNYVVIAGGAGTAGVSGGGGAGGLRTSYPNTSTLNGHNEAILSLSTSTNYTITIGAAGTAGSYGGSNPTNGNNTTFDTITST